MSKRRRRRTLTPGAAEVPYQPQGVEPQPTERSCQTDSFLQDKTIAEAVAPEPELPLSNSCQSPQVWHESLPPVRRAATHLTATVRELQQAVNELVAQGTREGSIAAYPKPNGRTYYNHVTCEQGKVKRVYLPLKQKLKAEAEIERGRQASKLQAISEQLAQLLSQLL